MNRVTRHTLIAYGLIGLEIGLLFTGFWSGFIVQGRAEPSALLFTVQLTLLVLFCMVAMQLYSPTQRQPRVGVLMRVGLAFSSTFIVFALLYTAGIWFAEIQPGMTLVPGALAVLCVTVFRLAIPNPFHHKLQRHRVLILGCGQQALWLTSTLRRKADRARFDLVGFVAARPESERCVSPELVLGSAEYLASICQERCVSEIVVALDDRRGSMPLQQLLNCRIQGITVSEAVPFLERSTGKLHIDQVMPSGLIFTDGFTPYDRQEQVAEWGLNSALAILLISISFPVIALAIVAIWLEDGRQYGIFYRQPRIGRGGKLFQIIKFRSMSPCVGKQSEEWAQVNDPRITRVGRWLRQLHIDELPQLINVLRGEMNIVGPRPEQPDFVDRLQQKIPFYHERHLVKPGLTGWAQIRYPYGASEKDALEKLKYDLYYIKRRSLRFNLQIFFQTIEVVLFSRGAR